jgi:sodium transport system permease protein
MKEARSYEAPMLYLAMFAGMVTFFPAIEINNGMALIPVVNIALFFKAVVMNEYQLSHLFLIMLSTLVLDFIAIFVSIKLFNSEAVLFRTDDDSSLKNVKKDKRNLFNPFYGMVYFILALLGLYYIGSSLQAKDLASGLFQTQVFIIVLPVMVVLSIFKLKSKEILRIKAPKLKELILLPFISIPATIIVSMIGNLINHIYPFPAEYLEKLMELFTLDTSLWMSFLIIAVTPGICEEIMFRGFLMRFFENNGKTTAVVISALLFAAFHLDPFRFIPVFILGLLLGYLTIRSGSIVNSMIAHTLNNGLALFIATYSSAAWMQVLLKDSDNLQPWLIIPALIVFSGAMYAFHRVTEVKES